MLAKKIFPGAANNLDALCRRYNIDITKGKNTELFRCRTLADVF